MFYDRPEIDPALTDTGLCYFFAYNDAMHPDAMKERFSTAQLYRKAILLVSADKTSPHFSFNFT